MATSLFFLLATAFPAMAAAPSALDQVMASAQEHMSKREECERAVQQAAGDNQLGGYFRTASDADAEGRLDDAYKAYSTIKYCFDIGVTTSASSAVFRQKAVARMSEIYPQTRAARGRPTEPKAKPDGPRRYELFMPSSSRMIRENGFILRVVSFVTRDPHTGDPTRQLKTQCMVVNFDTADCACPPGTKQYFEGEVVERDALAVKRRFKCCGPREPIARCKGGPVVERPSK